MRRTAAGGRGARMRCSEARGAAASWALRLCLLALGPKAARAQGMQPMAAGGLQGGVQGVQGVQGSESPFALVSRQLVEEECPGMEPQAFQAWTTLQTHFFESQAMFYSEDPLNHLGALAGALSGLGVLLGENQVSYQCPLACTRQFRQTADWALALGHPRRARALVQMGNIFKLQAMARWYTNLPEQGQFSATPGRKYEPRMQVEYTIAITQLHAALQTPLRPMARFAGFAPAPRVEIHCICTYKPDPTSNTGSHCPLPDLSVPNHRAYAERHGYRYVLHTEVPLPDREAHYSKMLVVHQALMSPSGPDWVFFVDCDAFFTNPSVSIADLLETYGAAGPSGPHFLVAEDPGGINTGTLLFRRSDWSLGFLERVAASQFGIAWDQSMFFLEMYKQSLFEATLDAGDIVLPPEVALVHQAHMNGFVPPASTDWSAYEWQPGDFVRHFAGCPWQEQHCLTMMRETAPMAR